MGSFGWVCREGSHSELQQIGLTGKQEKIIPTLMALHVTNIIPEFSGLTRTWSSQHAFRLTQQFLVAPSLSLQ